MVRKSLLKDYYTLYKSIEKFIQDGEGEVIDYIDKESEYSKGFFIDEINKFQNDILNNQIGDNIVKKIECFYKSALYEINSKFDKIENKGIEYINNISRNMSLNIVNQLNYKEKQAEKNFLRRLEIERIKSNKLIIECVNILKVEILEIANDSAINFDNYISEEKLVKIILTDTEIYENRDIITNKDFKSLNYLEMNKLAIKNEFTCNRQRGSHAIYCNKQGRIVVIPQHKIGKGLQIKIMKDIGVL